MVKYATPALDATFSALADPTRRAILAQLASGETSVARLAGRFDISLPGVMKHVHVLEDAGLLRSEKRGRVRRCRLVPEQMKTAADWIDFYRQFWELQLDSLARYFDNVNDKEKPQWPHRNPRKGTRSRSSARSPRPSKRSSTPSPNQK